MVTTIRQATVADANDIALLSRQSFYDTFAAVNTKEDMDKFMNESFSMETLTAEVAVAANIFLVACAGEELIGYAKIMESVNPPALGQVPAIEISRLYAAKKAIGQGVGKILMQAAISLATGKNKQLIWLGVWEHNQRAIGFYRQFGFEKFGEHPFVLGNDVQTDWLMKKTI